MSCSRSCNFCEAVGNLLTVTMYLQDTLSRFHRPGLHRIDLRVHVTSASTRTLALHKSQSCCGAQTQKKVGARRVGDPGGWKRGGRGGGGRGVGTDGGESKRALWVGHDLEPRPQFHEKTPREREERTKFATGEGKKRHFGRSDEGRSSGGAVERRGGEAQAGPAEGRSCGGVVRQPLLPKMKNVKKIKEKHQKIRKLKNVSLMYAQCPCTMFSRQQ